MTFGLTPEQQEIRAAVARLCERFGDEYWLKKDEEGGFPHEFHRAMAEAAGSASRCRKLMAAAGSASPRRRS